MVRNNDISFVKTVAHDQLSHLVINKINHVAMVTTSKNPNWRPISPSFGFYIYFLKKKSKTSKSMNFQRKTTEFVTKTKIVKF